MTARPSKDYVSRGGDKLAAALGYFDIEVDGLICADLGSHVGGFVDCLLTRGARRVYSVDTSYGTLAWKLRRDPGVVGVERTNAMHVELPEPCRLVTVDVGWTPQAKFLPNVTRILEAGGRAITLVKPHYEAPRDWLAGGVLPDAKVDDVVTNVLEQITATGWAVLDTIPSPIRGQGGNQEFLALLMRV